MRNTLLCVLLLLLVPDQAKAAIPAEMANLLTIIELKLQQPAPGFRVQILRISSDTFVDPPPQLNSFEGLAAFSLTFRPSVHKKEIVAAIELARKSKWDLVPHPAYPRWCLRFIGPWNEILGTIAIDEDNLEILAGDRWYKVEEAVVRGLTSNLLRSVLEAEATSGTRTPNATK